VRAKGDGNGVGGTKGKMWKDTSLLHQRNGRTTLENKTKNHHRVLNRLNEQEKGEEGGQKKAR